MSPQDVDRLIGWSVLAFLLLTVVGTLALMYVHDQRDKRAHQKERKP